MLPDLISGKARTCFGVYDLSLQSPLMSAHVPQDRAQYWPGHAEASHIREKTWTWLRHFRSENVGFALFPFSTHAIGNRIRWISSAQVATKMLLLARTTPLGEVQKPSEGLSLFFIHLDKSAPGLELKRIKKMGGRAIDANEIFFDNYTTPADTLIGEEGQGFRIVWAQNQFQSGRCDS